MHEDTNIEDIHNYLSQSSHYTGTLRKGDSKWEMNFTVDNTLELANDLQITEEYLGYVLAATSEYLGDDACKFDGKKCICSYEEK